MRFNTLILASLFVLPATVVAQGDSCSTAEIVLPGGHNADGPSTGGGASQPDAVNADWYAFTPVSDGYLSLSSCGGSTDTRVHLHTGACGALTLLASDDNSCPDSVGNGLIANMIVGPGVTYYIEWDDHNNGDPFEWQLYFHGCPIIIPNVLTAEAFSMTIGWEVLAPGAAYVIEYGPVGFTPGDGTEITGVQEDGMAPVIIGGLAPSTNYDVYITSDCGGGNEAPFNGPWQVSTGPSVNDDCGGALPITCGDVLIGSTVGATDDDVFDCGTSIDAPGIWYTFTGFSGTVILSTCTDPGYDTKINVYTGSCDELDCVEGNDDGPNGCYPGSEVIFDTQTLQTYLVFVQGYDGDIGGFSLDMVCTECAPPEGLFSSVGDTLALVYWTSVHPGATFNVEYGPDGFTPGTGTVITGIVGTDGPPATIPGLDPDTDYDVYVSEDCGLFQSPATGPLSVTTLEEPPAANAFCGGAIPISCGDSLAGNTVEGIFTPVPMCGSADVTTNGLWYSVTGNGQDMTVTTCDQASFDTKLSVFSGTCVEPVCVGGNDDGNGCPGNTSEVTFYGEPGVEYLVMVHGYDASQGEFGLELNCSEPCAPQVANDDCAEAQLVPTQLIGTCVPLETTNMCAYANPLPNPPCDLYAPITDVWFAFNSGLTGDHLITITPGSAGTLNAALWAACEEPEYIECFMEVGAPLQLTGLATGTTYLLQVWNGGGVDAGTFSICDEAEVIDAVATIDGPGLMRAWPSPTNDLLNVSGLPNGTRALRLLDPQGRVVLREAVNSDRTVIDMSSLVPGAYVLQAEGTEVLSLRVMRK